MPKQSFQYLVIILSIVSFYSCTEIPEPRQAIKSTDSGFIREIPTIKEGIHKGQEAPFHESINKAAFALHLDSLEAGYDSLQLRIWLGHSLARIRHVVVLKRKNDKWKGQLVTFSTGAEHSGPAKEVREIYPASGWHTLIDSLYKLKITTLPHETEIPGYNGAGGADGISYDFEIATSKIYRAYSYSNPGGQRNFWQAGNVIEIANFLEKELHFQFIK